MEMITRLQGAQYEEGFFHRLDPRVKIGLTLIFSIIGPLIENPWLLAGLTVLSMSYMLLAGLVRTMLVAAGFFALSMLLYLFIEAIIFQRPPKYLEYLTVNLTMFPIMGVGLLLGMTTSLEKLITGLGQLGIPAGMRYAIMVTMRYIAMLGNELRHVYLSMRVRGVFPGFGDLFRHPLQTLRNLLLPLLIRSFKIADRMGAAAELRGLSAPDNHLSLARLRWRAADFIFFSVNLLLVLSLWGVSNSVM
jgi:energy-coupling factor transport system permease protein